MSTIEKTGKFRKILVWFFPILFLIDDILGFNGYQFTIAGKSIRIILFCLSIIVLCAYSLYVCHEDGISLIPGQKKKVWLLATLKPLDYLVLLFALGNALWATVIPSLIRGETQYAVKDFSPLLVMILYFPMMFLIRSGRLCLKKLEKITYVLCIILAIWHCVMYIGETIAPGFYASYYDLIDIISFGTAVRSDVIYGFGITRVLQTTSLFLLMGIFASIRYCMRGKYIHIVTLVLFTFAISVTYTKSIWFGYALGLLVYLVPSAFCGKDAKQRIRSLLLLFVALITVITLNYAVFNNTIFSRTINTVRTQKDTERLQNELDQMVAGNEPSQTAPTEVVTPASTEVVTPAPTEVVTPAPTEVVTPTPTEVVTPAPTEVVTPAPTEVVTPAPTEVVTPAPTEVVTPAPTEVVTPAPTEVVTPPPTESIVSQTVAPAITWEEIEKKRNELWDARGTQMSLALRSQQNQALIAKWKQSLLFGFGYGSYTEDCIRNEKYPFMYESTLLALVMKLGVIGCMVWVVFIAGATIIACLYFWKKDRTDVFWWLGLAISYALAVQTNPFLFTFTGFSILLYLMIAMQEKARIIRR